MLAFSLLAASSALAAGAPRKVFVSGAGGQTGQHVFRKMLGRPEQFSPRGVVRSEASRAKLIESGVPAESVVVADITDAAAVSAAMEGCDAAVVCTSAKPAPTGETDAATGRPVFGFPNGQPEVVDWAGQKNQIDAAVAQGPETHVVICSSMGGTDPSNMLNSLGRTTREDGTTEGGEILLWKRKAEVYLIESGLPYTIVHPGGLIDDPGGMRELVLGVDDEQAGTESRTVPREDVAEVLIQALLHAEEYRGRSFDLRAKPEGEGEATTDFGALAGSLAGRNCDYSLGKVA